MPELIFYHGNKNYSSWSMRAWLALRICGAEFEEVAFHLGEPDVRERIRRHSPSGKVPALRHGERVVWDSLGIAEYLHELFPAAGLWPSEPARRAVARSIVAEMHSSFAALRRHMPFNVRRQSPGKGRAEGVRQDIDRITLIWRDCRAAVADADGPFLFGRFGLADAFYAPVVSRFRTYAVELDEVSRAYADAVWEHGPVREWRAAAEAEEWVEPEYDL